MNVIDALGYHSIRSKMIPRMAGSLCVAPCHKSGKRSESSIHTSVESSGDRKGFIAKYEVDDRMKNGRKRRMDRRQRFLSINRTPNGEGDSAQVEEEPTARVKMTADSEGRGKRMNGPVCERLARSQWA